MSILDYFKKTTLPNPNGSLSRSVPALAITNANKEVAKEVEKATCLKNLLVSGNTMCSPQNNEQSSGNFPAKSESQQQLTDFRARWA